MVYMEDEAESKLLQDLSLNLFISAFLIVFFVTILIGNVMHYHSLKDIVYSF